MKTILNVRLEKITAKALERMNHDRYKLSRAVGIRAKQINETGTLLDISKEAYKKEV